MIKGREAAVLIQKESQLGRQLINIEKKSV